MRTAFVDCRRVCHVLVAARICTVCVALRTAVLAAAAADGLRLRLARRQWRCARQRCVLRVAQLAPAIFKPVLNLLRSQAQLRCQRALLIHGRASARRKGRAQHPLLRFRKARRCGRSTSPLALVREPAGDLLLRQASPRRKRMPVSHAGIRARRERRMQLPPLRLRKLAPCPVRARGAFCNGARGLGTTSSCARVDEALVHLRGCHVQLRRQRLLLGSRRVRAPRKRRLQRRLLLCRKSKDVRIWRSSAGASRRLQRRRSQRWRRKRQ